MSRAPAIAIVTPTRNRRDVLLRAIESVRRQTLEDFEHIVVDDGSDDGTAEAVATVADGRLRFVRFNERRGANAARNLGIGLARSDLITFLDSDDEFLPFRLERSVALFGADPTVDLSISSFDAWRAGTVTPTTNRSARLAPLILERAVMAHVPAIAGSAITVRRAVLEAVGLFDEAIWRFQDRELLLRVAAADFGAATIEHIDWVKHHSEDSISSRRHGYVAAYGELLLRHPHLLERYPDIAAYIVARRLLSNLLQGHLRAVLEDVQANGRSPALGFSANRLVIGYLKGRWQRRLIRRQMKGSVHGADEPQAVP